MPLTPLEKRERRQDNNYTKKLENYRRQLLEVKKTTKNLEIKQFINLILTDAALFNINKHVFDFLQYIANQYPYNNGTTPAVLDTLARLAAEAEQNRNILIDNGSSIDNDNIVELQIGRIFHTHGGESTLPVVDSPKSGGDV